MIFIIAHPLAYYVKYVVLETTHQLTVCAPHEEEGIHFGPDNLRHCTTLERKTTLDTFTVIVLCVALYKQNQHTGREDEEKRQSGSVE